MLDLNLSVFSSTSNNSSSLDNADSFSPTIAYNFDILNNNNAAAESSSTITTEFVTKELFPCGPGQPIGSGCGFGLKPVMDVVEVRSMMMMMGHGQKSSLQQVKKSRRGPRSRSSQYRGVTFYRRTGRWESHIWDNGKQIYLGGFDTAHAAARAYDRAAIKFRGVDADINFDVTDYEDNLKQMDSLTKEEFVHFLRRQSTGFSRGSSKYRGVTLHKCGRWEARMGQLLGKKYIYLGLYDSEVDAARAYDKAALQCNGKEAVTNFDPSIYDGHNTLDLNLGIGYNPSVADSQMKSHYAGNYPFLHDQDSLQNNTRAKNQNRIQAGTGPPAHQGHAFASPHPSAWSGINPIFFPVYQEKPIEKTTETIPLSNWSWQIPLQGSHGGSLPVPVYSTAASSGFPSITTASSAGVGRTHYSN